MKNWYQKDREFLQSTFGTDWQLVAALLAATSPQVHIKISWNYAIEIYHRFKAGRQPELKRYHPAHRANISRALTGQPLSGSKVSAFYENLIGNEDAVTIDTWMLRLFRWFERGTKRVPTIRQHERLVKAFATVARYNGYTPAAFQAILWTHYRRKAGYQPTSYSRAGVDVRQMEFEYIPF